MAMQAATDPLAAKAHQGQSPEKHAFLNDVEAQGKSCDIPEEQPVSIYQPDQNSDCCWRD